VITTTMTILLLLPLLTTILLLLLLIIIILSYLKVVLGHLPLDHEPAEVVGLGLGQALPQVAAVARVLLRQLHAPLRLRLAHRPAETARNGTGVFLINDDSRTLILMTLCLLVDPFPPAFMLDCVLASRTVLCVP
jgi:hypothetical protein